MADNNQGGNPANPITGKPPANEGTPANPITGKQPASEATNQPVQDKAGNNKSGGSSKNAA